MSADLQHCPQIDTVDLKLQMEKRLGRTKLNQYLNLLKRFLCMKVSKSDFDRFCIGLLGRDNLFMHNKLIQSIIKNACCYTSPRRNHGNEKPSSNVRKHSFLQDVLPKSPRKHRTHITRDRRSKEKHNLLGHYVKPRDVIISPKFQDQQSATELFSLGSKLPVEVNSVEEGEEVDQHGLSPGIHSQSPLVAPIGVSIAAAKGKRRLLCHRSLSSVDVETCYNDRELPCSSLLKKRLERFLAVDGLKISGDCANLLNNGLDSYLKRLLKPCLDFSASRSKHNLLKKVEHQGSFIINGTVRAHVQNLSSPFSVCMTDFRAAVESDPVVLGEDWPVQFEKVCFRASEE